MGSYLDHAATAGMSAEALEAYVAAAEVVGNPSSLHSAGRATRNIVEDARESIAANLGAHPTEVVFTSGGTESNNLAIKGIYWAQIAKDANRNGIAVSALEHHSVIEPARWLANKQGARLNVVPVNSEGSIVQTAANLGAPSAPEPLSVSKPRHSALISIMLASNEIGTIQPIQQLAKIAQLAKVPIHTDAVAALGQIPISFAELGVDALSVAAHKIGGPIGVGALLVKRGLPIEPLRHGGEQERGLRAGTINFPGVAAFAVALRISTENLANNQLNFSKLRDKLVAGVLNTIPTAVLTGPALSFCAATPPGKLAQGAKRPLPLAQSQNPESASATRLPGNASFIFPDCDPDALLFGLDNAGFAASIGSACAAGVARPSEALLACGFDDNDARSSLRFTLGTTTSAQDIDQLLHVLPVIVQTAGSHG